MNGRPVDTSGAELQLLKIALMGTLKILTSSSVRTDQSAVSGQIRSCELVFIPNMVVDAFDPV